MGRPSPHWRMSAPYHTPLIRQGRQPGSSGQRLPQGPSMNPPSMMAIAESSLIIKDAHVPKHHWLLVAHAAILWASDAERNAILATATRAPNIYIRGKRRARARLSCGRSGGSGWVVGVPCKLHFQMGIRPPPSNRKQKYLRPSYSSGLAIRPIRLRVRSTSPM